MSNPVTRGDRSTDGDGEELRSPGRGGCGSGDELERHDAWTASVVDAADARCVTDSSSWPVLDACGPPLAIIGWTRLFRAELRGDEQLLAGLDAIERNAKAQTAQIATLLDVLYLSEQGPRCGDQRSDLCSVVASAVEELRREADERRAILRRELEADVHVTGYPRHHHLVTMTLLRYALTASGHGGRVDIELERHGDLGRLRVGHSGRGISAEELPHVFAGPRVRTRAGRGSLPLYLVRRIVEAHGGHVWAESAGAGKGAWLTAIWPLAAMMSQ